MLRQPWALAAAVLVLAVYVAVLAAMPKDGFWSPDEGAKLIQLHSVSWDGGFRYHIAYGAAELDPTFVFYPTHCHHEDLYPVSLTGGGVKLHWPVWFPFVHRPLLAAFGFSGLYVIPLLSGWLVALLAGYLVRAWEPQLTPWAIVAVGLGTPIAFFSLTFWEHTLAVLLGLMSLAMVVSPGWRRSRTIWLIAPLLLAAVALRVEAMLFAVAVVGALAAATATARDGDPAARPAVALSPTSYAVLALGVIAALTALLTMLPARHRWMLSVLPDYLRASGEKLPYLGTLFTALFVHIGGNRAPDVSSALTYAVLAACALLAMAPLLRRPRAEAVALIAGVTLVLEFSLYLVVRPEAYVSLHGLIPVAPLLVLAPYAVAPVWRQRRQAQLTIVMAAAFYLLLAVVVSFLFVLAKTGEMPTGLEWGNRYLLYLYPLGIVLALAAVHEYGRSRRGAGAKALFTTAAVALALCGVLLQARGVWTMVESRRAVSAWQAALRDGPPVVTDVWWLPAAMAPLFVSHEVQCVHGRGDLANWVSLADAHDVDTFVFASFRGLNRAVLGLAAERVEVLDERVVDGLRLAHVRIAATDGAVPVAP